MKKLVLVNNYYPILNLKDTEIAIKYIKDTFEQKFSKSLNLTRVSAPLFVYPETGLNDDLNGHERPVSFDILSLNKEVEIVQSLAKWKRNALNKYNFEAETGLLTDMNAIRRDEDVDSIHSIYVDQWDWECIIKNNERSLTYLKQVVKKIYRVLLETEKLVYKKYPVYKCQLPDKITFFSTKQLEKMFPNLSPKEREDEICKQYGAVFVYQIGWPLSNGLSHDGRASDYDDWNLNGDILVWYDLHQSSLELSSMGIRVNKESLIAQTTYKKETHKLQTPYALDIINDKLPQTIGGGIGQSRMCMYFLRKAHIGEVQVSVWSEEDLKQLAKYNINLL